MPARGGKVSAVGGYPELWNRRVPCARPDLNHAGHRIGTVKSALRAANELQPVRLRERERAEVKRAAGFIHRDSIDDQLVVVGFAAAHEQ